MGEALDSVLALKDERDRYREALQRIADGEVDGVGDYSECVQLFALATLAASSENQKTTERS